MPLSLFDRIFWSIASMILIGMIWVKLIERYINAWGAVVVGLIVSALIMKYGGQEFSLRTLISKITHRTRKSVEKGD